MAAIFTGARRLGGDGTGAPLLLGYVGTLFLHQRCAGTLFLHQRCALELKIF
jgi:hypothetical protein